MLILIIFSNVLEFLLNLIKLLIKNIFSFLVLLCRKFMQLYLEFLHFVIIFVIKLIKQLFSDAGLPFLIPNFDCLHLILQINLFNLLLKPFVHLYFTYEISCVLFEPCFIHCIFSYILQVIITCFGYELSLNTLYFSEDGC